MRWAAVAVVALAALSLSERAQADDDPNPNTFHQTVNLQQSNPNEWNSMSPCAVDFWARNQVVSPPPGMYHYNLVQWGGWTSCTSQYWYAQECIARIEFYQDGIWKHLNWSWYSNRYMLQTPPNVWTGCQTLHEMWLPDYFTYRLEFCFGLYAQVPAANWWFNCYRSEAFMFPT